MNGILPDINENKWYDLGSLIVRHEMSVVLSLKGKCEISN